MKLVIEKNRSVTSVGTWGTKNENNYEILEFEFPQELEEYNKRIVYYLGDEKVWDIILDNKIYITNAVTKYERVKGYVWLTKGEEITLKYVCTGDEEGNYYFTYDENVYYFTMPEVQANDELIFDVATEKLKLNDTEIQTSSTGTGTELTFSTEINAAEDFRTKLFEMNFYENENADGIIPTEEQVDGFNTMLTAMSEKIDEVDDKIDEIDEIVDSKIDEIDTKIDEVNEAVTGIENLNIDVSDKVDGDVTVTLTKKDNTTKTVVLSDGTSLMFQWIGTSLGIKTEDEEYYTYVDLQGIQGPVGPKGEAFTIKKTYSSVSEMNADFNNMQLGDYVMIASTVEIEDNAKLYTRGEESWIFISDFSGAQGIKGETGATPNIQIGSVVTGTTSSVTRSGTNENPIFNFVLEKGEKGDTGDKGEKGDTGNGIASIEKTNTNVLVDTYTITYTNGNTTTFTVTNAKSIVSIVKTSTAGLVDTYTITYNDGTTSTFEVTNGQDGEVTQEQLDEVQEQVTDIQEFIESELEQETTEKSTRIDITNAAKWYSQLPHTGRTTQKQLSGKNLFDKSADFDYTNINRNQWHNTELDSGIRLKSDYNTGTPTIIYVIKNISADVGKTIRLKSNFEVSGNSNGRYVIGLCASDGSNRNQKATTDNSNDTIFFQITQTEQNQEYLYVGFYLRRNENSTVNDYIDYKDIVVTINDEDMTYEEYCGGTASPNPDFPQEIRNVEGRSCRNLFSGDFSQFDSVGGEGSTYAYFKLPDDTKQYTLTLIAKNDFTPTRYTYIGFTKNGGDGNGNYKWAVSESMSTITKGTVISIESTSNLRFLSLFDKKEDTLKLFMDNFDIQLDEGFTSYEPYFEGKRLELNVCNKNLGNMEDLYKDMVACNPSYVKKEVVDGKDCIVFDNSKFQIRNNFKGLANRYKKNTRYKVDCDVRVYDTTITPTKSLYIQARDINNDKIGSVFQTADGSTWHHLSFITDNSTDFSYIIFSYGLQTDWCLANLSITEYVAGEEYKYIESEQKLIPFPLQDGQKLMEGDYLADDGVHHVRGKTILPNATKLNAITLVGVAGQYVVYSLPNGKPQGSTSSNNFISNKLSYNYNRIKKYTAYTIARSLVVLTDDNDTLENFNSNITGSIVEYELAEETIDPYTPAQLESYNNLKNLMLYKGVNHIWTNTDGLEPNLQLTYYKSNKERLNNIEARLELLEN